MTQFEDEPRFEAAVAAHVASLAHDPSPEFVRSLRNRLAAEPFDSPNGLVYPASARRRWPWSAPRWLPELVRSAALMLAGAVIAIAAGPGLDLVSAEALPDSPLYTVKEAKESVEAVVARAPQAQAVVLTRQIEARVAELDRAVRENKPRPIVDRLAGTLAKNTTDMVDRALEMKSQGQPLATQRAAVGLRLMRGEVEQLEREAIPPVKPSLHRLLDALNDQARRLEP